jgi:hypothetical protein
MMNDFDFEPIAVLRTTAQRMCRYQGTQVLAMIGVDEHAGLHRGISSQATVRAWQLIA